MRTALTVVVAALSLSGCAAQVAQHSVRVATLQQTVPTCTTERDCELKWSAARSWILSNAGMKLQHVTADFLETYNPPPHSASLAVRVVKEPMGSGGYRLIVRTWCNNFIGCIPDTLAAAQHFNDSVNAVGSPAVAAPRTPARQEPPGGCWGDWKDGKCVAPSTACPEGMRHDGQGCARVSAPAPPPPPPPPTPGVALPLPAPAWDTGL